MDSFYFSGYSLKLTYFISPYDLLDAETKTSIPLTVDGMYLDKCLQFVLKSFGNIQFCSFPDFSLIFFNVLNFY